MIVPFILTTDVEIARDHDLSAEGGVINSLCEDLFKLKVPLTAFVTADYIKNYPSNIETLLSYKNEIGCHGNTHEIKENYKKMGEEDITFNIDTFINTAEAIIPGHNKCFRGPGMSTSATTQRILVKKGFSADFSVCSQRLDFFRTKGGSIYWLVAPRLPYNPSVDSPYTTGDLEILNIPLSCLGLPFISGILYLFGINFMKLFFRMLFRESLITGKPIVYLFHIYEFLERRKESYEKAGYYKFTNVQKLYKKNRDERYFLNMMLFRYILSFPEIMPFSASGYLKYIEN